MEKGTNRRIESKADGYSDGNRKSKHQIQKEVLLVLTAFFVQFYLPTNVCVCRQWWTSIKGAIRGISTIQLWEVNPANGHAALSNATAADVLLSSVNGQLHSGMFAFACPRIAQSSWWQLVLPLQTAPSLPVGHFLRLCTDLLLGDHSSVNAANCQQPSFLLILGTFSTTTNLVCKVKVPPCMHHVELQLLLMLKLISILLALYWISTLHFTFLSFLNLPIRLQTCLLISNAFFSKSTTKISW